MATEKLIAANRLNALKSTGPRTAEGKARSRFNALKHGLLSRAIIIDTKAHDESREEFDTLLGHLIAELSPVGTLEHLQVERIAVCYWRSQRALRAEALAIHDRYTAPKLGPNGKPDNRPFWRFINQIRSGEITEADCTPENSESSPDAPSADPSGSGAPMPAGSSTSDASAPSDSSDWDSPMPSASSWAPSRRPSGNPDFDDDHPSRHPSRNSDFDDDHPSRHPSGNRTVDDEFPLRRRSAGGAEYALPTPDQFLPLLRYETTIDRQLQRAMDRLEKLQAARFRLTQKLILNRPPSPRPDMAEVARLREAYGLTNSSTCRPAEREENGMNETNGMCEENGICEGNGMCEENRENGPTGTTEAHLRNETNSASDGIFVAHPTGGEGLSLRGAQRRSNLSSDRDTTAPHPTGGGEAPDPDLPPVGQARLCVPDIDQHGLPISVIPAKAGIHAFSSVAGAHLYAPDIAPCHGHAPHVRADLAPGAPKPPLRNELPNEPDPGAPTPPPPSTA